MAASEIERSARLHEPQEGWAAVLQAAGYSKEAGDVLECGHKFVHCTCRDDDHQWDWLWRCRVRVCPICASARARRLFEVHKHLCGRPNLKHMVLTIPNVPHLTGGVIDELRGYFTKLRRRKRFKRAWRGGIYSIEMTFSQEKRWHVHLHVLIDGAYVPQPEIVAAWREITGGAWVVSISRARSARQALKYIVKPGTELLSDPAAMVELMEAIEGKRLTQGWGVWYKVRSLKSRGALVCPECGGRNITVEIVPSIARSARDPPLQSGVPWGGVTIGEQADRVPGLC